jgi:hypothetical protein
MNKASVIAFNPKNGLKKYRLAPKEAAQGMPICIIIILHRISAAIAILGQLINVPTNPALNSKSPN